MSHFLTQANLEWHTDGTPISNKFGDIYFSSGEGVAETLHVFINGNCLLERWLLYTKDTFVIGETGFGTGLNFLIVWLEFKKFRHENPDHILKQLRFVSVEKFPISISDLQKAYQVLPQFSPLLEKLIEQYPAIEKGQHIVTFDNEVILELWFDDVHEMMSQRMALLNSNQVPYINAWFLDGFAPSKNPDMWSDALFNSLAKQSQKGTSIATFTAAGFVRRGLISAGFTMKKSKGFGRKREMLIGYID